MAVSQDYSLYIVIAAGGSGSRFSEYNSDDSLPKQFLFIDRVVDLFASDERVSGIACALPREYIEHQNSKNLLLKYPGKVRLVQGGALRQNSVFNALQVIKDTKTNEKCYVLIHDAVRPYVSNEIINNVIEQLEKGALAVVPAIFPVDSVIISGSYTDRNKVSLVQTPQGFVFDTIYELHEKYKTTDTVNSVDKGAQNNTIKKEKPIQEPTSSSLGIGFSPIYQNWDQGLDNHSVPNFTKYTATDDASLCSLEGIEVLTVAGDIKNKKITYRSDMESNHCEFKIGFGFDSHEFSNDPNRKLKLCGVAIDGHKGLRGVSDADVAIHSIIDAILGALSKGSIGEYFPEDAASSKDADSADFLKYICSVMLQSGYEISNLDITIICDSPKIKDYRQEMTRAIASLLCTTEEKINVKGKTTEGTLVNNGIAAMSNVLLTSVK